MRSRILKEKLSPVVIEKEVFTILILMEASSKLVLFMIKNM